MKIAETRAAGSGGGGGGRGRGDGARRRATRRRTGAGCAGCFSRRGSAAEVPEGMDPDPVRRIRTRPRTPGPEIGRYVSVLWEDDGAWYDAIVTEFANDRHTLRPGGRYRGDLGPASRAQTVVPRGRLRRAGADPAARRPAGLDEAGEVRRRRERLHGSVRAKQATAGNHDARRRRGAANAEDVMETDDAGERKRHACRACLRNGVVAEDTKFGKKCPFHLQYAKPEAVSRVHGERRERHKEELRRNKPRRRRRRRDERPPWRRRKSSASKTGFPWKIGRLARSRRRVPNRGGRGLERRGRRSGTHRGGEHSRGSGKPAAVVLSVSEKLTNFPRIITVITPTVRHRSLSPQGGHLGAPTPRWSAPRRCWRRSARRRGWRR